MNLCSEALFNHILLRGEFFDKMEYKYLVEVSVDGIEWQLVIDHTKYACRSNQYLYFAARTFKMIRLSIISYSSISLV